MIKIKHMKNLKMVALILALCLIAPFNAEASGSLYQDMWDLLRAENKEYIEHGGFQIEPTTNTPTNSFEAEFELVDGEKKLLKL